MQNYSKFKKTETSKSIKMLLPILCVPKGKYQLL